MHVLASSEDPDTMYYHEAMKEPDAKKFKEAMIKKIETHEAKGHWKIMKVEDVPEDTKILDMVWAMKRKRRIATGEVYKYKARINIHGGQQEKGINYWDTYAPVVSWYSIRLLLTLCLVFNWHSAQIDFVLAYPQADVECELYVKLPRGFHLPGKVRSEYCLKVLKNLYGSKQAAGLVWNEHLYAGLTKLGF